MSVRVARLALVVLIVGLALHNLAMALLWDAGVRDTALDVVAGWKDVLLLVALAAALFAARALPTLHWADRLALAYGAIVVVYWLLPQSWLDGEATARGELYALRHHLLPLGAYLLGRLLPLDRTWWRRIGLTLVGVACGLAVWGLVDVYLVPLETWRDSGVPGWFEEQLGLAYECLSGLPENWILNTDEESPVRRLVSTFLSPLATAYALVVVLLLLAAVRPRRWTIAVGVVVYVGLLFTHTRAAFLALAAGLLVLAALRRSWTHVGLAAGSVVVSLAFVAVFPTIGPQTTYTATELACLRENAAEEGDAGQRRPRPRRELDRGPLARAPRRDPHRRRASVGIRARERRRLGVTHRCRREGGRVDVHRARRGHRSARARRVRRLARGARPRAPAPVAVADRLARGLRRPRAADGRDRDPLARGRGARPRGRRASRRHPTSRRPRTRSRLAVSRRSRTCGAARRRPRPPSGRRGRRSRPWRPR